MPVDYYCLYGILDLSGAPCGSNNRRPCTGKMLRDCLPDTAASAGNDGSFIGQINLNYTFFHIHLMR
jgi:hypothetical protein